MMIVFSNDKKRRKGGGRRKRHYSSTLLYYLYCFKHSLLAGGRGGGDHGRSYLGQYTEYLKQIDKVTTTDTTIDGLDVEKWWDEIWERKLKNVKTTSTTTSTQQSMGTSTISNSSAVSNLLLNPSYYDEYNDDKNTNSNITTFFEQVKSLFLTFPEPTLPKTIELYNGGRARNELLHSLFLLQQQQQQQQQEGKNKNFTIVAVGGSSTAGTGAPDIRKRFYTRLGQYLGELLLQEKEEVKDSGAVNNMNMNIEVINRGHGSRNTLHATNLLDNFVPQGTDLLIWEFAINDYWTEFESLKTLTYEEKMNIERQSIIAFLHEVGSMKPKPPKVILLHFWSLNGKRSRKFGHNKDGTVFNPVWDAHLGVASKFDFVIGHVQMASYLDELHLPSCRPNLEIGSCLFLHDRCHPNNLGNLAATYLMLSLLRGKGQWSVKNNTPAAATTTPLPLTRPKYEWDCGTDTEEKRIIKKLVTDDAKTGWKRKLGSWTSNVPVNDVVKAPSRQLVLGREANLTSGGKAYDYRADRQTAVILKKCTDNPNDDALNLVSPVAPIIGAKAIGFALSFKINNVRLTVNSGDTALPGRFIFVPRYQYEEWPCAWVTQWGFSPGPEAMSWFVFETEQDSLSSLSLCVSNSTDTKEEVKISTLWVY